MKIKNYYIIALLGFTTFSVKAFSQGKNDTLYINDGKGVNGIVFDSSSMEDIQKVFGKGTIVKTPTDPSSSYDYVRLNYYGGYFKNGHGLEFLFVGEDGKKPTLKEISIGDSMKAKTSGGIILNKSTTADVIAKYGAPAFKDFYGYNMVGIAFGVKAGVVYRIVFHKPVP